MCLMLCLYIHVRVLIHVIVHMSTIISWVFYQKLPVHFTIGNGILMHMSPDQSDWMFPV